MKKSLLILAIISSQAAKLFGQSGVLDPSFGTGTPAGTSIFTGIGAGAFEQGMAIQSDNKILVSTGNGTGMGRLNPNGTIDNTFGTGGWISVPPFSFGDILLQADGKILAAGRNTQISYNDLYVYRIKSNGTFDTSFGKNGRVGDSSIGSGYGHIAIQSGNKIVFSGSLGVKRLNMTDGSLDATFGASGFVRMAQLPIEPLDLMVDPSNGNIYLSGITKSVSHIAIVRLTPNGQIDASFGTNGVDSLNQKATGLSVQMRMAMNSLGTIILASEYDNGSAIGVVCAGFTPSGAVDNTFGTSGQTILSWNYTPGYILFEDLSLSTDDKIYLGASVSDNANPANQTDVNLQRLTANGQFDASYTVVKTDINHSLDYIQALKVLADGKVLINGSTSGNELVARYTLKGAGVLSGSNDAFTVEMLPNPASSNARLQISSPYPTQASVAIFSMDGKLIRVIGKQFSIGLLPLQTDIDISELASGLYRLEICSSEHHQNIMFQKL